MTSFANLDAILPALPAELDFQPVRERQMRNGKVVDGQYWVVNPNNDQVIGAGGSRHKVDNFADMWDTFRAGMAESTVDLTGAEVKFTHTDNFGMMRADVVLPKHNFIREVGEETRMKLRVFDSHNQTAIRSIDAQILRLACLNGMETVSRNLKLAEKHTTSADPKRLGMMASEFPELLRQEAGVHSRMQETRVLRESAIDFLRNNLAVRKTRTGIVTNAKRLDELVGVYDMYGGLGQTAYRLYNTLTHISTHVEVKRSGAEVAVKRMREEAQVQALVQGDAFRELCGLTEAA